MSLFTDPIAVVAQIHAGVTLMYDCNPHTIGLLNPTKKSAILPDASLVSFSRVNTSLTSDDHFLAPYSNGDRLATLPPRNCAIHCASDSI